MLPLGPANASKAAMSTPRGYRRGMSADTYTSSVTLEIEGMTCAGCVSRVERKLNELDSVDASVNLATESARVRFDPARVQLDDLVGAVTAIGYGAAPAAGLRRRHAAPGPCGSSSAALLSAPLVALMLPPLQFAGWEWVSFALATPVVLWAGLPFHRAALLNARHARGHDGHADLDRDARRLGAGRSSRSRSAPARRTSRSARSSRR